MGGYSQFSDIPFPDYSSALTIISNDPSYYSAVRADFDSEVSSVSLDLGDHNSDADRIFLSLYDSSDNLLATITQDLAQDFIGMVNLSLSAIGVDYALFGTTGELGFGGIYADNFSFETAAVPEPATLALLIGGLAGIGVLRKHRR